MKNIGTDRELLYRIPAFHLIDLDLVIKGLVFIRDGK